MFEEPRFIENSFSITFNRQLDIRRRANDIEDFLKSKLPKHYSLPMVVPLPDEVDPQLPRLIFSSTHGYSQIVISQVTISLNVKYSPDYQLDTTKRKEYLKKRIPILFELIEYLGQIYPYFSGLITRIDLDAPKLEDSQIIGHLINLFLKNTQYDLHDLEIKITKVIDEQFFSNIVIRNFKEWQFLEPPKEVHRLSTGSAVRKGIQIIGDFNDRFAFNEKKDYFSQSDVVDKIIYKAFAEIDSIINCIRG